ncbi:MAG: hypothetical protein J4N97_07640 [Chloroflexi bacterium]|nr:hypothetical protein [Chloroflexota bacterium]
MKKRIITFIVVAMLVLVYALPVSAHTASPCNDTDGDGSPSGREYAKHHISALAKAGNLGHGHGFHVPGTHQGFSLCNPSGK